MYLEFVLVVEMIVGAYITMMGVYYIVFVIFVLRLNCYNKKISFTLLKLGDNK